MWITPSFIYNGKWWLFSSVTSNDKLYLHYARLVDRTLEGTSTKSDCYRAMSTNPDPAAGCSSTMNKLYRFTMDIDPPVGTHQVMAYEITEITPDTYSERLAQEAPVVDAQWFRLERSSHAPA